MGRSARGLTDTGLDRLQWGITGAKPGKIGQGPLERLPAEMQALLDSVTKGDEPPTAPDLAPGLRSSSVGFRVARASPIFS